MDVKEIQEKFEKAIADMRAANDARLAEIEKKGRADPLLEKKVDAANEEISRLAKELKEAAKALRELETKYARPGKAGDEGPSEDVLEHRKAYDRFLRKGDTDGLADLQQKAVSIGADTEGGYAVTDTLDTEIEKYERDNVPMRGLCRIITVSNENFEKLVQQGGAASGWVDEAEARTETGTPTLAAVKPYFGELYANPASTQKALDDAFFNVEGWLGEEVGTEFAEQENAAFTSGTGVKKPRGILGYTAVAQVDGTRPFNQIEYLASGGAGTFTGDNLIDLIHRLKRGYRNGAAWMMSNLGVAAARKLKDGQNNYLWQQSPVAGQPSTLFGYPVEENDDWVDPAADAFAIGFGNFRRAYWIVDVRGIRVLRDPFTNKPKVHFYTTKRVGGFLVNDRAIKLLKLAAA